MAPQSTDRPYLAFEGIDVSHDVLPPVPERLTFDG